MDKKELQKKYQLNDTDLKMLADLMIKLEDVGETKYDEEWIIKVAKDFKSGADEFRMNNGILGIGKTDGHFDWFEYWPDTESLFELTIDSYKDKE